MGSWRAAPAAFTLGALVVLAATTGCGTSDTPAAQSAEATTSAPPSPYEVLPARGLLAKPRPETELPEPVFDLEHGGTYTALFFAVLDGPDGGEGYDAYKLGAEELRDVDRDLKKNFDGRYFGEQVRNCDIGAEPALNAIGIESPVLYISLHFATPEDAKRFAESLSPSVLTMATVQAFCD